MNATQALGVGKKLDSRRVGTRQRSQSRSGGGRRTNEGQLVGASEGKRDIPSLASDSQFSRRFGVPIGSWKNYLHPSASVARSRQVGRPVFQAQACCCSGDAHACGQTQAAGHSFPKWVPNEILRAAQKLTEKEAASHWRFFYNYRG